MNINLLNTFRWKFGVFQVSERSVVDHKKAGGFEKFFVKGTGVEV